MCGAADVRMFKWVNCREILRGLSADVMGKLELELEKVRQILLSADHKGEES